MTEMVVKEQEEAGYLGQPRGGSALVVQGQKQAVVGN